LIQIIYNFKAVHLLCHIAYSRY